MPVVVSHSRGRSFARNPVRILVESISTGGKGAGYGRELTAAAGLVIFVSVLACGKLAADKQKIL